MSAWLPRAFEPAVKTMIADGITTIHNKAATLSFVVTTNRIETNPTTWSVFTLSGQVCKKCVRYKAHKLL
jgi:hypothetical protein